MYSAGAYLCRSQSLPLLPITKHDETHGQSLSKIVRATNQQLIPFQSNSHTNETPLQSRKIQSSTLLTASSKNLVDALAKFNITISNRQLGDGGFSTVYNGKSLHSSTLAIKILKENNPPSVKTLNQGEVDNLRLPPHENIIKTHGVIIKHKQKDLFAFVTNYSQLTNEIKKDFELAATITEKAQGEDFFEFLSENTLSEKQLASIALQLSNVLAHIENHDFIYRDLKEENIIYDKKTNHITVIDFDSLKKLDASTLKRTNSRIGTIHAFSPAMFNGHYYDTKNMSWVLGTTLMSILINMSPADYLKDQKKFDSNKHSQDPILHFHTMKQRCNNFVRLNTVEKTNLILPYTIKNQTLVSLICNLLTKEEDRPSLKEAQDILENHNKKLNQPTQ